MDDLEKEGSLLESDGKEEKCSLLKQSIAVSGAILVSMCGGMVAGFSAILLPQLKESDSDIQIDTNQESLLASIAPLLTVVGSAFGGWSMDKFGRKKTNIITSFSFVLAWTLICLSTNVGLLLLGRIISGFGVGMTCSSLVFYLGEVSHPNYRGLFMASTCTAVSLGVLVTHVLGTFVSWKVTALVSVGVAATSTAAFVLPPESHVHYINRNELKLAKEAFRWFRGNNSESRKEWNKLFQDQSTIAKPTIQKLLKDCCTSKFIKPLLISNLFFVTCQVSGYGAVTFYCVDIMRQAVPHMNEYVAMITIDLIRTAMSAVACVLTKKFKVRPLALTSGFGTGISLLGLVFFRYLSTQHPDQAQYLAPLSTTSLIAYVVFVNIGLMPLPWTIASEIFNPETKSVAGGIATAINSFASFAVVQVNPSLFVAIGSSWTFSIYALLTILGTAVLVVVLPETKDMTLKEIEHFFNKRSRKLSFTHSIYL